MFSSEYANFCNEISGRYIHHVPHELSDEERISSETIREYKEFLFAYEDVYRDAPPAHLWPDPEVNGIYGMMSACGNSGSCGMV